MTLAEVNELGRARFVATLGGIYEHSPWVAERAWSKRPFANVGALHDAMAAVVASAATDERLALIRAHPELAGKAMVQRSLTADSSAEQAGAGLTQCSSEEFAQLQALNAQYNAKFGFPFVLAVKGYDRRGVIAEFERRVENDRDAEFAECLRQIDKIARMRLETIIAAEERRAL